MALQLPMNYVDVEREEMEYVDGGVYIPYSGVRAIALACGIDPVGSVLVGLGYYRITAMFAAGLSRALGELGDLGGPIGAVIGFAIGGLGAVAIGGDFADALIQGEGIDFSLKYTAWGHIPYGVNVSVE
jgi:hypothetical protein